MHPCIDTFKTPCIGCCKPDRIDRTCQACVWAKAMHVTFRTRAGRRGFFSLHPYLPVMLVMPARLQVAGCGLMERLAREMPQPQPNA